MPCVGEERLRLDFAHREFHKEILIAARRVAAARDLPSDKRPIEIDTEPGCELAIIGQRLPDARHWRILFDVLSMKSDMGNLMVAF